MMLVIFDIAERGHKNLAGQGKTVSQLVIYRSERSKKGSFIRVPVGKLQLLLDFLSVN